MRSRSSCRLLLVVSILAVTAGCHYVHFGRPERFRTDSQLATENSDLRVEKKLLQQELAIARKEGETLRAALDRPQEAAPELVARLNETTRELAELRASYARLQSERERLQKNGSAAATGAANTAALEQIAELKTKLGETEDQLANALRTYTALQEENNRLRTSIDQARTENATLTARVETITAENNEAQSALAQLNTELLAQKEARAQAEQRSEALRAQLLAMANAAPTPAPAAATSLAAARESTATGAREIEGVLRTPVLAADSSAGAMLSVDTAKLRNQPPTAAPAAPAPAAKPVRVYVVEEGDTLEKIAQKIYGRPDRWSLLYAANNALLSGGRPLKPGLELEIPAEE
ncbi:LysM peptidoglycan-binding domain-containing protein [Opitutus terrae]|uniref:Peptidoglycan-binding LysM n=1 Tax=Opitutus terrae (strain DSM 11246 / JCM 15787 / PB90-1) TaxID=452637 RepID=B1ZSS6_OPITP|nr:LysM domain-containing protein [Opitutus terrae]ACB74770.1 Peptidoglycan-binding LysM [Opitutus terrae PB90-1]